MTSSLIVRVEVEPQSIAENMTFNEEGEITYKKGCRKTMPNAYDEKPLYINEMNSKENLISITYSVEFRNSNSTLIATKWDYEDFDYDTNVFWISMVRSFIVCL